MTLLAFNIDLEMKVAQLEQGLLIANHRRFQRRLASSKAEIKLYNHQYYD